MKLNVGCGKDKLEGWVNCDINPKVKPDVVCDAHDLPFEDGTVDTIIAHCLLEHVERPQEVINEFHRVLEKKGILVLRVPFMWVYHGSPDYWRFTKESLQLMLQDFKIVSISQEQGFFHIFLNMFPRLKFLDKLAVKLNKKFKSDTCALYKVTATK